MSETVRAGNVKRLLRRMSAPDINLNSNIFELIMKTAELFYLESNRLLRPFNLTLEQSALLTHLYMQDGISQKSLAENVFKDQANTTRILKRLLEKGYVNRTSSEHDKRQNLIFITKEGQVLVEKIVPLVFESKKEILKELNVKEHDELKKLLVKFYQNISVSFAKHNWDAKI